MTKRSVIIRDLQEKAIGPITDLLIRFGLPVSRECWEKDGGTGHAWLTFQISGKPHVITVADNLSMETNEAFFECEWRREFSDPSTLAQSFAKRLTRYLEIGQWDEPE